MPPDPLPISFLEEAAAIAAIEDGVTPSSDVPPAAALGNLLHMCFMRCLCDIIAPRKDDLRRGKWTPEEENYANK